MENYCCEGYYNVSNTCKPYCKDLCVHGICIEPYRCKCNPGYLWNEQSSLCEEQPSSALYLVEKCENDTLKYKFNNKSMKCEPYTANKCIFGEYVKDKCECHKGYKLHVNSLQNCQPICSTNCNNGQQGKCIGPEKCECNKGYKLNNITKTCQPTCTKNCKNGECILPNKCKCNQGHKLNNLKNECEPICSESCESGKCYAPDKCETICTTKCENGKCFDNDPGKCICNSGYIFAKNTCRPVCLKGCKNGTCLKPGKCQCNLGYVLDFHTQNCKPSVVSTTKHATNTFSIKTFISSIKCDSNSRYNETLNQCQPLCFKGCHNGNCIAANTCICNSGYMWNSTTQHCDSFCKIPCTNGYCDAGVCFCNSGYMNSFGVNENHSCEKTFICLVKYTSFLLGIVLIIAIIILIMRKYCTTKGFYIIRKKSNNK